MTRQEIFDTVVINLRKQGRVSEGRVNDSEGVTCLYRNKENGCRCAAGWLIPDEDYDPSFEGQTVRVGTGELGGLRVQNYFIDKFGEENLKFIQELQTVHDAESGMPVHDLVNRWNVKWADIAAEYGLTMPA